MIETKDAVLIGIGFVGWGLAVYLYIRNEWTKRPLVSINFRKFKPKDTRLVGVLAVRNRGPWNVSVESLKVARPKGATIMVPRPHRSPTQAKEGEPDAGSATELLNWPLRAYASGEFPSRSSWFEVNLPAGSEPPFVDIDVSVDVKRPAFIHRRQTTRHRIKRARARE